MVRISPKSDNNWKSYRAINLAAFFLAGSFADVTRRLLSFVFTMTFILIDLKTIILPESILDNLVFERKKYCINCYSHSRGSRRTVQRVCAGCIELGAYTWRLGSGSQRRTTQRDDNFIVSSSLRNLQHVGNVNDSDRTGRRRLKGAYLNTRYRTQTFQGTTSNQIMF